MKGMRFDSRYKPTIPYLEFIHYKASFPEVYVRYIYILGNFTALQLAFKKHL